MLFALRLYLVQSWTPLALALVGGMVLSNFCSHPGVIATLSVGMFLFAERAKNGYDVHSEDIRAMLYIASFLGLFAGLIWGWFTGLIVFAAVNLIVFAILIGLDMWLADKEACHDIF